MCNGRWRCAACGFAWISHRHNVVPCSSVHFRMTLEMSISFCLPTNFYHLLSSGTVIYGLFEYRCYGRAFTWDCFFLRSQFFLVFVFVSVYLPRLHFEWKKKEFKKHNNTNVVSRSNVVAMKQRGGPVLREMQFDMDGRFVVGHEANALTHRTAMDGSLGRFHLNRIESRVREQPGLIMLSTWWSRLPHGISSSAINSQHTAAQAQVSQQSECWIECNVWFIA